MVMTKAEKAKLASFKKRAKKIEGETKKLARDVERELVRQAKK